MNVIIDGERALGLGARDVRALRWIRNHGDEGQRAYVVLDEELLGYLDKLETAARAPLPVVESVPVPIDPTREPTMHAGTNGAA